MTLLNVLLTKMGIAERAIVLLNRNEHRVIRQFYGYILGYNIKKLALRNIKYRTLLLTSWLTYILRVTRASTNIKVRLFAYILSIVRFDRLHVRCFSAGRTMYHFRMKSTLDIFTFIVHYLLRTARINVLNICVLYIPKHYKIFTEIYFRYLCS